MNSRPMTEHPTDAIETIYLLAIDAKDLGHFRERYLAMNAARTTPIDDEGLDALKFAEELWDRRSVTKWGKIKEANRGLTYDQRKYVEDIRAALKASLPTPVIEEGLVEKLREALIAADKRLCELSPTPPPDGFECPDEIARDAETCGIVMQIREAIRASNVS